MAHARRMGERKRTETLPPSQARVRVQLDFSVQAFEKLQELKQLTDARSNAEVIRSALRLYEWYVKTRRDNYQVQIAKDDQVQVVQFLG